MPYDLPRIPLPTSASSAELAQLSARIRQQSLFSARLSLAGPVADIGGKIQGVLDGTLSESEFRRDIRESLAAAGYVPEGAEGSLLDHRSRSRLDLILTQNVRAARNYGQWAQGMDPAVLDQFPAQELVRVYNRNNPRPRSFWRGRWSEAGGSLHDGRMVALKTSPVWTSISRFGVPYPPYDYGSGMGVIDVDRDEAVRLGLIAEDERMEPAEVPFPQIPQFSMPDLSGQADLVASVLHLFPDASFEGGVLKLPEVPA